VNGSVRIGTPSPAPLFSPAFVCDYAVTMRPYLLFVSGITGVLGLALAGAVPAGAALGIGLACFLSYGFGQALTDCFQLDTDAISAPYRPLVRGRIRRTHVLAVSLAGLIAVGGALVAAHPWNVPLVIACVAGLATYTWFKRRPWAGPFYNAGIVVALLWTGVLAGLGTGSGPLASPLALLSASAAAFFGYADFVLAGYFKDISADRRTGYRTLPVAAGRSAACLVSDFFAALAIAGALCVADASGAVERVAHPEIAGPSGPIEVIGALLTVVLIGSGILAAVTGHARLHTVREDDEAHRAIVPIVHAYMLLLTGAAVAFQPGWAQVLVPFLAGYFVTMAARPARQQI